MIEDGDYGKYKEDRKIKSIPISAVNLICSFHGDCLVIFCQVCLYRRYRGIYRRRKSDKV